MEVEVSDLGKVNVDIAYGGSFYVIVRDSELGVNLSTTPLHVIGDRAIRVCDRVKQIVSVAHPENDSLSYLVGTIVTDGKDDWSETEPTSSLAIVGDKSVISISKNMLDNNFTQVCYVCFLLNCWLKTSHIGQQNALDGSRYPAMTTWYQFRYFGTFSKGGLLGEVFSLA